MDQVFFYLLGDLPIILNSTCYFLGGCFDNYCMFSHVLELEIFHILFFVLAECLLADDDHIYCFTGAVFLSP